MWTLAWLALAWSQEAEVGCPPDAAALVVASAEQVADAWYALDEAGFAAARERMDDVSCVQEALTVDQAVALHRAHAIEAFVDGDMDAARRSFAALRTLAPSWTPPADQVPPDHPLWKLWASSLDADRAPRTVEITVLPEHGWSVDGARFDPGATVDDAPYTLPLDRAFVLQIFDDDTHASYTGYHLSALDVPVDRITLSDDLRKLHERRRKQAHIWGSVVSGLLVAGAATTFGLGWSAREEITSGRTELVDIEAVAARSNMYGDVTYGLAGAGALALTVAWSVRW